MFTICLIIDYRLCMFFEFYSIFSCNMKMAFIAVTFSNLTRFLFFIQYFNILYYFIKIINFCRKYAVQMVRGKTFMST